MNDEQQGASVPSAGASQPVHDPRAVLRSVTAVLRGGPEPTGTAAARDMRDRRSRMHRAEGVLMAWERLSRPEAFAVLSRRPQQQRRSIHGNADDVLRNAESNGR